MKLGNGLNGGQAAGRTLVVLCLAACFPRGGDADGSADTTSTTTAPTVGSVSLSPTAPRTNDVLIATAGAMDPEGDALTVTYAWSVNGVVVQSGVSTTLDGAVHFDKDDVVSVLVTADDGAGTGTGSATVTVQNTPPTAPEIRITPEAPVEGDALTCEIVTPSFDADGDALTYTYAWEMDGVATAFDTEQVPAGEARASQRWDCVLTSSDGASETDAQGRVSTPVIGICGFLIFDGLGDAVRGSAGGSLNFGTDDFTIEMMLRIDRADVEGAWLLHHRNGLEENYLIVQLVGRKPALWLVSQAGGLGGTRWTGLQDLPVHEWLFLRFERVGAEVQMEAAPLGFTPLQQALSANNSVAANFYSIENSGDVTLGQNPPDEQEPTGFSLAWVVARRGADPGVLPASDPRTELSDSVFWAPMDEGLGSVTQVSWRSSTSGPLLFSEFQIVQPQWGICP